MSTRTSRVVWDLIARDNASRTFARVSGAAHGLNRTATGLGAALRRGFAAGTVATAGLGASVLKMAGDFEKNMNRVEALSGATGSQLEKLRNQAKELGRSTQYGAAQSADAMAQLATAGLNVNQIYGSMPSVLALASSEQLDLTRAAEISTSVMTGYGMTVKQMPHAIDAMVKASVKANTSVDDLGEAFKYAGPIAHQAHLQFEEAVASMALMGNAGIKASMAGTALRGAVTRLLAPTHQVQETLDKLGVSVRTADGHLLPLTKIVDQLAKKGATTGQIMTIFGQRAGPGMAALIQQGSDKLAALTRELEHSGGTADRISKIQMKGWRGEVTRLKNAWEGLMISVGDTGALSLATKSLTGLTTATRGFTSFVDRYSKPAAQRFKSALGSLIPIGKIKRDFGEAKSVVADFFKGLGLGGGEKKPKKPTGIDKFPKTTLGRLTGAPHLGSGQTSSAKGPGKPLQQMPHYGVGQVAPTTGVHGPPLAPQPHGGSGLVAPLIHPKAKPPKSAAQRVGETIRKAVTGGISDADWSKVGSALGGALGKAFQWVAKNGGKLGKQLAKSLAGLDWVDIGKQVGGKSLGFAIGFVASFGQDLFSVDFWKKHWWDTVIATLSFIGVGKIAGPLSKVLSHIPVLKMFAPLLRGISHVTEPLSKAAGKVVKFFGSNLWKGFAKVFPHAAGIIEREASHLTTRVGVLGLKLLDKGKAAAKGLGSGLAKGAGWVIAKGAELVSHLLKPFAKAASWLLPKGRAFVGGLRTGIVNGAKGIAGWVSSHVISPATGRFARASSWLLSKGRAFVGGLRTGIVNGAKGIAGWVSSHVISPATSRFSRAGSWLLSKGASFVSGFKTGITRVARSIGGWTSSHIVSPVTSRFSRASSWLVSKGSSLIGGFKSGIIGAIKGISSWIKKHVVDPVVGAVKKFFGIRSPSRVFMGIGGHLVAGLIKGMAKTNGTAIAKKIFGSLPKALAAIAKKGLVSITSLPGKALRALGGLGGDILGMLGLGGGGGGSSSANQRIGQVLAAARGWSGPQWAALKNLWMGESGWNERALNKSSGAYGIPQSLPASKMASAGADWRTNPATQIKWGLSYIASRYGNPVNAYSAWLSRSPHWYAKGGFAQFGETAWVGEKGAELMQVTPKGTRIFNHQDSMAIAKANGIRLPGYASGTIQNAADRVRRDREKVEDARDALARAKRRHKGVAAAEARLRAAQKELQAAEISLKNAKRSAKTSIANTIATGLQKTLSTGTASAINSAIKSLATKLLNAGYNKTASSVQKKGGQLASLADKKAGIQKTIAQANEYASDQASKITDFLSISGTSAMSVKDLISQMTGQQKTASNFVALTRSLKARGASKELLDQLSEAGPGSQLATILGAKNVTTQDIAKLNSLAKSGGKLATSFGRDMADLMYDSGKDAGKGFLAGLKSQEAALAKQMSKLAADLVKQIKKALKIKSPSVLMRDEVGKQIALGMVVGMDRHRPHVAAAGRRLATTAYAASAGASSARANAAFTQLAQLLGSGQLGGTEVHVHFDDPALRDLIRVTTKPLIQASHGEQAYRAKVGRR
ncbi:phage tail tape measure protein [Streptomyces echinoruber]|uniref:Phage tail tape measure protein domain-containing protein n=1 Tax=Streptomyces echinoruber TaxID=68898 RepID=A0A918RN26_9ACTN|nr:phage tail tape measure protein [Streptomyces echinoruber]GHA01543.1 hypothetical protein GCM10010389_46150 [Streptomyces echinoruber]